MKINNNLKNIVLLSLLIFLVFYLTASHSQTWEKVGNYSNGSTIYIDNDSLRYNSEYIYFKDKIVLRNSTDMLRAYGVDYITYNRTVNCNTQMIFLNSMTLFDKRNRLLKKHYYSYPGFDFAYNDVVYNKLYKKLCKF